MNIKGLTNNELIQIYKDCNYSLRYVDKKYNLTNNTFRRLLQKRNIDYNKIKNEYLLQQKQLEESKILYCENCGKVIDGSYGSGRFCNKQCATAYGNLHRAPRSEESKKKTSISVKKNHNSNRKLYTCIVCNKQYFYFKDIIGCTRKMCSEKCREYYQLHFRDFLSQDALKKISNGGKHSCNIQSEQRRSKNEKLFCTLCENFFNIENVFHNKPIFNGWDADIILPKIKYAILWNGKWHYEQIKKQHSVKQVQNRDNIKINEIKKCGWIPYVIKDMGKYNKAFVNEQFNIFINYLKNNNIILRGSETDI